MSPHNRYHHHVRYAIQYFLHDIHNNHCSYRNGMACIMFYMSYPFNTFNTTFNRANPFNTSSRFVFLDNCSERPVAVWPRDPFGKLPGWHPEQKWFHVIDRNQSMLYDWAFLESPDPIEREREQTREVQKHRDKESEREQYSIVGIQRCNVYGQPIYVCHPV